MALPGAAPFIQDGLGWRSAPDRIGELGARYWAPELAAGQNSGCIRGANADSDDECPASAAEIDAIKVLPLLKGAPWRRAHAEARRRMAGRLVLAWAHAHPADLPVLQALHPVARKRHTGFGGCGAATASRAIAGPGKRLAGMAEELILRSRRRANRRQIRPRAWRFRQRTDSPAPAAAGYSPPGSAQACAFLAGANRLAKPAVSAILEEAGRLPSGI